MPLRPRFRRVAALDRRFVDRESALEIFARELGGIGSRTAPRVLNVTGVGGIGKSRLLRELRSRATDAGFRTAGLDLQVPAMRQQEDALAVLRRELGDQGVRFDRFDIAYAVLWQRLHPHLKISGSELPFAAESEILTDILGEASGVPVVGTAIGLLKLGKRAAESRRRRRSIRLDETLGQLDELPNADVVNAVTYYFAEDVRAADGQRCVLFVDAYEALAPTRAGVGRAATAGAWLRDLIAQLDTGLTVLASREPVAWRAYNEDWEEVIRPCPVEGLPMAARLELLTEAGIDDGKLLAEASQGVPFYLHLAMDTGARRPDGEVVSSEEILSRFLHHVADGEIQLLELLSVPRVFDCEIFEVLAEAFHLPGDRMRWESVTGYSFVYPAGDQALRLHQLMVEALRARLSPEVTAQIHARMRRLWDERAVAGSGQALREAAYHGVRTSSLDPAELLNYADRAVRGGKRASDGIRGDLAELDLEGPLAEVARCLDAEAAVRMGDAGRAATLAGDGQARSLESVAGARLAIAAAHGMRIGGDTSRAAGAYQRVWEGHDGPVRFTAGLWVADLHMWQGRFATAFQMIDEVLDQCPADDLVLRGDLVRLAHLGHRFHLDFEAAAEGLREARDYYQRAKSVIGQANIATNEVELAAWRDPEHAVRVAPAAIEAQQELAALHELGKTHTALAVAQLRLGEETAAASSFEQAHRHLERAGYRSGRARAELFTAILHVRRGAVDQAARSVRWAVDEFLAAEVYPTLIVAADHLLSQLEVPDDRVSAAAASAREQIQPLDSPQAMEERTAALVRSLLGDG